MQLRKALCAVVATAALVTLWLGSCSKTGSGDDVDDGNNPYMILDLHVASVTDSTITLAWTATGDDADQGTATTYDLRMSKSQMTNEAWDSAIRLTGEPSPSPAGTIDSMKITGLDKDSTYYFAVEACDEAANCSGRSNCAVGSCFEDIVITFPDSHLENTIRHAIFKPTGDIHRSDLLMIQTLDANDDTISDLAGMEYCVNAVQLFLSINSITDLSPLANLGKLQDVQFFANNLTSIPSLPGWTSVQGAQFAGNSISDISGVAGFTSIHLINFAHNQIQDLAPLVANLGLAGADTVWLEDNPLSQTALNTQIPVLETRGVTVIR